MEDRPLSNTTGAVLDPVFSLRCRMRLKPNETAQVCFATAIAHSRDEAMSLADKYHDPNIFEREARLAWTRAQLMSTDIELKRRLVQRIGGVAIPILRCVPARTFLRLTPRRKPISAAGLAAICHRCANQQEDRGHGRLSACMSTCISKDCVSIW